MKVDADPLPIADTNYVEPTYINMVEVVEEKVTEDFVVIDGNEATEGPISEDINVETADDYDAGRGYKQACPPHKSPQKRGHDGASILKDGSLKS